MIPTKEQLNEAYVLVKEEVGRHYNIPKKMTSKGYHEVSLAMKTALRCIEIVKGELCDSCRCKIFHPKGCQCWNDE